VYESDLQLISLADILFKYSDDTNVLVSEITDVCHADEVENIKEMG
jgi:hypothetical protein